MKKIEALALLVRSRMLEALEQPDPELDGLPIGDAQNVVVERMDDLINSELAKTDLTAKWLLGWVRETPEIMKPFMEGILMEIHGDVCKLIEDDIKVVMETAWNEKGRSNLSSKP